MSRVVRVSSGSSRYTEFRCAIRGGPVTYHDGNLTCASWSKIRGLRSEPNVVTNPESWVWGYLSAYNDLQTQGDIVGGSYRMDAAIAWLDTYCGEHPLDSIRMATKVLIARLHRGD